jgi:hypothetical protein
MQTTSVRYLFLALVLITAAAFCGAVSETHGVGAPRWPADDAVYASDAWTMAPLTVEHSSNNTDIVSREYRGANGIQATLSLVTNQAPKLYGPGAEVPFLGSGFTVEQAPSATTSGDWPGIGSLTAVRGQEHWLVMYAYGERRGLLGNGPLAWTLALLDGLMGSPHSYYKMYLLTRMDPSNPSTTLAVAQLASSLFPKIAGWYAG